MSDYEGFTSEPYTSFRIFMHEEEWKEVFTRAWTVRNGPRSPELREAISRGYRCTLFSYNIPPADIEFEPGVELSMVFDDELNK
jgi:hypothetical protein